MASDWLTASHQPIRSQISTWGLHPICAIFKRYIAYKLAIILYKLCLSNRRCLCTNTWKITYRFDGKSKRHPKLVEMQYYRWMECVWTFHQQNVGHFYGSQRTHARHWRVFLMRYRPHIGLFILYLAMMTQTGPIELRKTVFIRTYTASIPVYDILLSSPSCHSYAPCPHA